MSAANQARKAGADVLITIGGGSLTDGAKAVVLCLALNLTKVSEMSPYRGKSITGSDANYTLLPEQIIPLVCVPTTLSGGEYTPLAGVSDLSRSPSRKEGYSHPLLKPCAVLYDPTLTRHTPEWLFLSTGVRAIDHCVEALCSVDRNPYTSGIASSALRMLSRGLVAVKKDFSNVEARALCQYGVALASATIVQVSYGASHAIGHVLGGSAAVPHGYTSCVLLPCVLKWNSQESELASALEEVRAVVVEELEEEQDDASQAVDALIRILGMPRTLDEMEMEGIVWNDDRLKEIAQFSMYDPWTKTNPRIIHGKEDVLEILLMARSGVVDDVVVVDDDERERKKISFSSRL